MSAWFVRRGSLLRLRGGRPACGAVVLIGDPDVLIGGV